MHLPPAHDNFSCCDEQRRTQLVSLSNSTADREPDAVDSAHLSEQCQRVQQGVVFELVESLAQVHAQRPEREFHSRDAPTMHSKIIKASPTPQAVRKPICPSEFCGPS
eukprot:2335725-Pyramimonas_sp.AAC.1